VDLFSLELKEWQDKYGCVANFGWKYDVHGRKLMIIDNIDMIIYRKPPPNADTFSSFTKSAPETTKGV